MTLSGSTLTSQTDDVTFVDMKPLSPLMTCDVIMVTGVIWVNTMPKCGMDSVSRGWILDQWCMSTCQDLVLAYCETPNSTYCP